MFKWWSVSPCPDRRKPTMRRLLDKLIRITMDTLLITTGKESTKGVLSHIYRALEGIVRQAVNRGAVVATISPWLDRLTASQQFAQKNCMLSYGTPTLQIESLNWSKEKLKYLSWTKKSSIPQVQNDGNKYEEATPLSPLTERCLTLSTSGKHGDERNMRRNRKPPTFLDRHARSAVWASVAQKAIMSTVRIKVLKMLTCDGR